MPVQIYLIKHANGTSFISTDCTNVDDDDDVVELTSSTGARLDELAYMLDANASDQGQDYFNGVHRPLAHIVLKLTNEAIAREFLWKIAKAGGLSELDLL